jgi:3-deoxy-D-manno-octulosonic-acid transferase
MRFLYSWALRLLWPWVLLRLAWRGFRNRDYWRRIPERFGFVARLGGAPVIWIHAVSVGEARAGAPLARRLLEQYPGHRLLITTMTPTGSATVRGLFSERVEHCYVPYDYPSAVRRFLDRTAPRLAIVMETELWPNLFYACRARSIPLVVANVRLSERSAQRYARFATLVRQTLQQVSRFGVQCEADAARLVALGASPASVTVTGSIKFEINLPASLIESAEVLRREWGAQRPVWLAASTHDGEDEAVLAAHAELRRQARFADALLVLVPRHPERFGAVTRLCRRQAFVTVLRSESRSRPLPAETAVLVGDTMGEMQLFYAAADAAFVGGSLVPTGGHNLLEAAAVGKPAVFGPHMFNFAEIAAMTLERGAGVQIQSAVELTPVIAALFDDPNRRDRLGEAGRKMVEENRGALARTCALLPATL